MRGALLIVAPLAVAIVAQVGSTGYDRDPGGGWPEDPTLQQLVKDTGLYGCTIETITPADVDGRASHVSYRAPRIRLSHGNGTCLAGTERQGGNRMYVTLGGGGCATAS